MILVIAAIILFLIGLTLLFLLKKQSESFGILKENKVYSDTKNHPGEVLYSSTIELIGKPDYLIKKDGIIYPVEIKTGKTPTQPYLNHTMQLMAYCYLIEENYHIKPPGGYLKYPNAEFKIAYTDEARESVKEVVKEIMHFKQSGKIPTCDIKIHNH